MPDEQVQRAIAGLLSLIQQSINEQNRINRSFDDQINVILHRKNQLIHDLNLQIERYKQQLFILQVGQICTALEQSCRASDTLRLAAKLLLLKFETIYLPNASPEYHIEILQVYNSLLKYPDISDDGLLYTSNNLQPLIVMAFMLSEFRLLNKLADNNIRLYNNEYLLNLYQLNKDNPLFAGPIIILEKICLPPELPKTPEPIEPPIAAFESVSLAPELPKTPETIESPSPEPINLDEFEYIPLPTSIIITPTEKIDESISNLDYQNFNNLLAENKHLQDQIFSILQKRFEKDAYNLSKIKNFLLGANIDIATCEKLLRLQKTNINTKKALLDKIVSFDDAEHSKLRNPESLLNIANDLRYKEVREKIILIIKNYKARVSQPTSPISQSSTSASSSEDVSNKLKLITVPLASHTIKSTTKTERQDIFYLIEHATENQLLNISLANKDSLNATNNRKQTALILAIQKKLHPKTIQDIIKKSKHSILLRDENQHNALDYWASYYNDYSHETILSLWQTFKQTSKVSGHKNDANFEINLKRDKNGNNFLHILLRNPEITETQALKSLQILFTKRDDKGFEENIALYGSLVVKNIHGEIPTYSLYNKDSDWKDVYELLYSELPIAIMALSKLCHEEANIFFPPNTELFSSNKPHAEHPIYSMLENAKFERVINVIERELNVKSGALIVYESLRKRLNEKGKTAFDNKHTKIKNYFGKNGFYWQHKGQSVYGYIIDHLCNNPELQYLIDNNCDLFLEIEERVPYIETIAWKKIIININEQTLSDELRIYIKQLSDKINTPDYVDKLLPLDYAFMTNNVSMAKFLIEVCNARVDDRALVNCLSMAPSDDLSIFDYIFDKFFVQNNQEINNSISITLFLAIVKDDLCHSKYSYLVEKGFNPAATDSDKRNLLQILIINCNVANQSELIPQVKILLDKTLNKPETIEAIITNVDRLNNSAIDYLSCEDMSEMMDEKHRLELYKLIINSLDCVSSVAKLQHLPNVHFLCYIIMLNNVEGLNTTLDLIEKSNLQNSVLEFRLRGLTIQELVDLRHKSKNLTDEFRKIILSRLETWSTGANPELTNNKQQQTIIEKAQLIKTILQKANQKNESKIFDFVSLKLSHLDSDTKESIIFYLDNQNNSIMDHIVYSLVQEKISKETAQKLYTLMFDAVISIEKMPRPGTGLLFQLILLDHTVGLENAISRIEEHPQLIEKILAFRERGASFLEIAKKNKELKVLSDEFLNILQATFDRWSKANKLAITNKLSM